VSTLVCILGTIRLSYFEHHKGFKEYFNKIVRKAMGKLIPGHHYKMIKICNTTSKIKINTLLDVNCTCFQMWMSVHSAVITVTAMHNVTTFLDLSLANVTTRMATMATALNALFTVCTILKYSFI